MFLAWRELKHSKLKFGLIGLIIFLIVFLVLFVTGLAAGLASDNGAAIGQSKANSFILQKGAEQRFSRSTISQADADTLTNEVANSTPLTIQQSTIQEATDKNKKTDIAYFVVDRSSIMAPTISDGKSMAKANSHQVVVSDKLTADGYKIGDKIKDSQSGESFTIIGFTKGMTYSHTPVIYLTESQWKTIDPQVSSKVTYNAIAVKGATPKVDEAGFTVESKATMIKNVPGYSAEQLSLQMMIGFLYVISVVVLAVFFYVITIQKIHEFGVLKALGTKTSYLAKHLIGEIGIIALSAVILGDVIVALLATVMPSSMPFIMTPTTLALTSVLFIVVAVISALISLIKVAKVDPVSAIGGNQ